MFSYYSFRQCKLRYLDELGHFFGSFKFDTVKL